jgi:uncharacterized protein
MYRSVPAAVTAACVATVACAAARAVPAQATAPGSTPPSEIVTTGRGEARVSPDRATLLITVETRAATAAAAAAANATRQRATLDALRALGLGKDQLSTAGYDVAPEYAYDNARSPRVTGYVARNTVRAEVRQIDQVGRAIDAALGAGATTIASVQFSASNADSARRAALASAVTAARGDADVMARAAGGSLGPLLSLSTAVPEVVRPLAGVTPMRAMAAGANAPPTPLEAGDIDVTAEVTARWQFKQQ